VNGKPVSVRLTLAITFSLALPKLAREPGIPELRQGVAPAVPRDAGRGVVTAEVSLESDGRIAAARIVEGTEPWAGALLKALQTWRFTPPPEDASLSFRVEAEFDPGRSGDSRVVLKAAGLQRGDLLAEAAPAAGAQPSSPPPAAAPPTTTPATAATPATPAPAPAPPATPPADQPGRTEAQKSSPAETPAPPPPGAPAQPRSGPDAGPPPAVPATPAPATPGPGRPSPVGPPSTAGQPPATPPPVTPAGPVAAPGSAPAPGPITTRGTPPPADRTAPPPVEVITAPPPQQPPENGVSAIRDVALEPGVPDLTRGRRPVPPPFARIAGAVGTVEVAFSVSAAGTTMVQSVAGPDLLKKAAEQAVVSWVFRRTRTDRAYLRAVFSYGEDKASAVVRPQPAPSGAPTTQAAPVATALPPAATPPAPQAPGPGTPPVSSPAPERPNPSPPQPQR
jgi:hypothetical protein